MLIPGQEVMGYEVLGTLRDIHDPTMGTFIARQMNSGIFIVGTHSDDMSDTGAVRAAETYYSYTDAVHEYTRNMIDDAFAYEDGRNIAISA